MSVLKRNFEFENVILVNFINLTDSEKEMVRVWRNNEDVRKWMYTKHVISKQEHCDFIKRLKVEEKSFYWLSKNKQGECIGVIDIKKEDLADKHAHLGIYKNPDCKLRGAGTLLMECLKGLSFDIADLQALKLEVSDKNDHAINFYKRMGFQEDGRRDEFIAMSIRKGDR